ncbi:MAG: AI-2E family transporter [Caldilinea sp.]|uniref:AI-2E family transporter n=1 Tax=Caldilinea sp. TaxID=2293560 RepID=UPI002CBB5B1F|nr:AI-2E family transporter [Anaerolineales bacterium]HQY92933.1 AI-2E family transporter [Caldilinea sp.]
MTKQLAVIGAAVMTTLMALAVLWQFRIVVIYVLISLTLTAALRPLANRLVGRGLLARVTWSLLYLAALGSFGYLLFLAGDAAIREIQQLAQTGSGQDKWMMPAWLAGSSFQPVLAAWLPPPSTLFSALTGSKGQLVLPALFGFTQGIGGIVSGVLFILLLSIYWALSETHFERFWLSLLSSAQRKEARSIWRTVESDMGAYLRSQVTQSLLAGLLLGLGFWLLGSPYPVLLAFASALACLVPVVGPALALIPPLVVGLLTGVQLSLFSALYALAVLFVLGVWVNPRLFNRGWDNAILTVVLLIALGDAFGLAGIIVAPPLSVVCQILWSRLIIHRRGAGAADQLSNLKERQERVWDAIRTIDEPYLPIVTSSMERLTQLIAKVEPVLESAPLAEPFEQLQHGARLSAKEEQNA